MKPIALSKATLATFGVDPDVLAYYGYQGEATPQPLTFDVGGVPIDITNYTFSFSLTKQTFTSAKDSNSGYDIKGRANDPLATPIDLTSNVTLTLPLEGKALLYFPASITATGSDVDGNPTIYAGFLTFEDNASVGELIQKVNVLVIVE